MIIAGNEELADEEAIELIRMLINDARQIAGVFHGENRSAKFRANWPDEYGFAESEWRNFMEAALVMYAEAMGDPKRSEHDKRRMYLASVLWHMAASQAPEHFTGEQIMPGSEKFEGSKRENVRITGMFGRQAMSFAELALPNKRFH